MLLNIFLCLLTCMRIYTAPLSVHDLDSLPSFDLKSPQFLKASDSAALAYYDYTTDQDTDILIFYAGPGLYGNKLYQSFAKELQEQYHIGCYIFDIRGHGHSQGPRGDTRSTKQVFVDVKDAIAFAKQHHPSAAIYLAGHSTGAGLLVNFAANMAQDDVDGFILLTPYLGATTKSLKEHKQSADGFIAKTNASTYSVGALFPTGFPSHHTAVYFDYSPELLENDPLIVPSYTLAMSLATTPTDPKKILHKIQKPTLIVMGKNDDAFLTKKKKTFNQMIPAPVETQKIEDTSFISVLRSAPELIADYLESL